MKSKRKKAAPHDSIEQLELPFLWPDRDGLLALPRTSTAQSSVLPLRHLPRSPRGEIARASRLLRSQSFVSWLWLKSSGGAGLGTVRLSLFEMWLSAQLEKSAFNALRLEEVIRDGAADLDLEENAVLRMVFRLTRPGATFKAEDGLITFRG